jgi:hypothetical protein
VAVAVMPLVLPVAVSLLLLLLLPPPLGAA